MYDKLLGAIVVVRDAQGEFVAVGKCLAYQEHPTVIVEKVNGERLQRRADMVTLLTNDQDIVQGLMSPKLPQPQPLDNRSAVVQHTLVDGQIIRRCIRCMMAVDEYGNPDPKIYSPERIAKFAQVPVHERCVHRRAT